MAEALGYSRRSSRAPESTQLGGFVPIIDNVKLQRTPSGWNWSGRSGRATVVLIGKSIGDYRSTPWPLHPTPTQVASVRQVHSASIRVVPPASCLLPADAIASNQAGVTSLIATADCVPILLFDGSTTLAIHAGWRGIAGEIVPRSVQENLDPTQALNVWIGPHIGPCCYQVGNQVADRVAQVVSKRSVVYKPANNPHLDLGLAVLSQLQLKSGDHVVQVRTCTQCSPESLWSYRRDGVHAGRNLAAITLDP